MASVKDRVAQFIHDKIAATPPFKRRFYREEEVWAKVHKQEIGTTLEAVDWVIRGVKAYEQDLPTHKNKSALLRVDRALRHLKRALYHKDATLRTDLPPFPWEFFPYPWAYFPKTERAQAQNTFDANARRFFEFWIYNTKLSPRGPRQDVVASAAAQAAAQIFQAHDLIPNRADLVALTSIICGRKLKPRSVACRYVFTAYFGKKARSATSPNRAQN
jgi:hypothetical protein